MREPKIYRRAGALALFAMAAWVIGSGAASGQADKAGQLLRGAAAFGDFSQDHPGVRRLIRPQDLPQPYATASAENGPSPVARPADAWPQAPPGFKVELAASGLSNPRNIVAAPDGNLFFAESGAGEVKVLHGINSQGKAEEIEVFASGLHRPFGIAFYPPGPNPEYLYIANTDSVVRYAYRNGDLRARGSSETVVPELPGSTRLSRGGHWTRNLVFDRDGKKMYVSVGSRTNDQTQWGSGLLEKDRADILEYNPDGSGMRVYASGIRNPVGLAVDPATGQLWTSVNERDGLGDNLPPDYITHVTPAGFYGWPWYYIGPNQDPRHKGEQPELKDKVLLPDVLLQAHSASLCLAFYQGQQFPQQYRGQIFAAEHGSWNRSRRTGYKVIVALRESGKATGEYEDFLTGFVTPGGDVWGRPVGVAVASDGSLLVTDDGSNSIWRVSYEESKK